MSLHAVQCSSMTVCLYVYLKSFQIRLWFWRCKNDHLRNTGQRKETVQLWWKKNFNQEEISYSGIPGSCKLTVNSAAAAQGKLQLSPVQTCWGELRSSQVSLGQVQSWLTETCGVRSAECRPITFRDIMSRLTRNQKGKRNVVRANQTNREKVRWKRWKRSTPNCTLRYLKKIISLKILTSLRSNSNFKMIPVFWI